MVLYYYFSQIGGVTTGNNVFGLTMGQLYWIAFFTPVIHQLYVWIIWRIQLYYNAVNRYLGKFGYGLYVATFVFILLFRFGSIFLLANGNRNTLVELKPFLLLCFVVFQIPIVYLFYSVIRYFGVVRATGIDHFDPSYHNLPLETRGIYKYVNNAMYLFGLLIFYLPGLFYASLGALLIAVFNHVFIWVHYFTLEKPDMEKIYH